MTVSKLKVRFPTKFPASVTATSPLSMSRTGGSYTFSVDIDALRDSLDPYYAVANLNSLILNGATSGTATVQASAISGSSVLTLPAATDTLVGKATTDTLTNKTLDSAGTGNVLKVSGVTVSRGQFPGTSTNDSATAGNIGEYKECKTTAATSTVTISNATPGVITWANHGLTIGSAVNFTTTGGLPTGLSVGTNYYVSSQNFAAGSFCVSTSQTNAIAGTSVNTSSAGSGTQTAVSTLLLTSTSGYSLGALSLTAGDWDINSLISFNSGTGTVVSKAIESFSTTDATLDTSIDRLTAATLPNGGMTLPNSANLFLGLGKARFSLSSTTTIFLVTTSTFTTSTLNATGIIRARRVR